MYSKRRMVRRTRIGRPRVSLTKKVKDVLWRNTETKYVDVPIDITASTVLGAGYVDFNTATAIPVGAGRNNRVGNKIKIIGMRYNFVLIPGDDYNEVRIFLASNRDGSSLSQNIITYLQGPPDTEQYKILRDIHTQCVFAEATASTSVPYKKYYKGYLKLNMNVQYVPVQNTPSEGGMLGIQFHSDSSLVPNPQVKGFARIYYKDI